MSAVVFRCPNCGTVQDAVGECEACHEAAVRPFCANHTPGRWLDTAACAACGARPDFDPLAGRPAGGAPRGGAPGRGTPARGAPLDPGPVPIPVSRGGAARRAPAPPPPAPPPAPPPPPPPRRRAPRVTDPDAYGDVLDPARPPRPRRERLTPADVFGPDSPLARRWPGARGGAGGRPPAGLPPLRLPTVRVPGVLGCLGRVVMLVVFLILAALAGSFVWITQF